MNSYDINYGKTTKELLEYLNKVADNKNCDGSCDEESPYIKCDRCEARQFLNKLAEDVRNCCRDMSKLEEYRKLSL